MSERIYCPGPVAPPKRRPATGNPAAHDSHVVGKNRYHGDRDGEITYYLVGPQRETFEEAEDDLSRFEGAEEREAGQAGALAALRGALEGVREAIASLPRGALGEVRHGTTLPTGEAGELVWPIRDELVDRITCILQSRAGRKEAEVLRAAIDHFTAIDLCNTGGFADSEYDLDDVSGERLRVAVDALRAAPGGEG